MFERETRKEKTLDLIKRQADTKKAPKEPKGGKDFESKKAEAIKKVEDEFFAHIGKNEPDALQDGEGQGGAERDGLEERKEDSGEQKSERDLQGTQAQEDRQQSPELEKKSDHNISQEKSAADLKVEQDQSQQQGQQEQQQEGQQEQSGEKQGEERPGEQQAGEQ